MNDHSFLTIGEFTRRMDAYERNVLAGQSRIEDKVDAQGERIVVLETADRQARKAANAKTVGWGSAVAGAVMLAVEAIKALAMK